MSEIQNLWNLLDKGKAVAGKLLGRKDFGADLMKIKETVTFAAPATLQRIAENGPKAEFIAEDKKLGIKMRQDGEDSSAPDSIEISIKSADQAEVINNNMYMILWRKTESGMKSEMLVYPSKYKAGEGDNLYFIDQAEYVMLLNNEAFKLLMDFKFGKLFGEFGKRDDTIDREIFEGDFNSILNSRKYLEKTILWPLTTFLSSQTQPEAMKSINEKFQQYQQSINENYSKSIKHRASILFAALNRQPIV